MGLIRDWVDQLDGFARKRELVARGALDHHLTEAVRTGEVLRARNGWYSTRDPGDDEFRAVRVGGRLTSGSALFAAGAWMRERPPLSVSLPQNASRQRSPRDRRVALTRQRKWNVTLHWDDADVVGRGSRTRVATVDALYAYVLDSPLEEAVAALDWAVATEVLDRSDFELLILRLPKRLRAIRDWVDPQCGSYPESISRTRFRLEGLSVTSQVPVGMIAAIDLVIEGIVGLEVDGRQFHAHRFEYDRDKDLDITLENKHALRISATMISRRWRDIVQAIRICLIARGWVPHPSRSPALPYDTPTRLIGTRSALRLPPADHLTFPGEPAAVRSRTTASD